MGRGKGRFCFKKAVTEFPLLKNLNKVLHQK